MRIARYRIKQWKGRCVDNDPRANKTSPTRDIKFSIRFADANFTTISTNDEHERGRAQNKRRKEQERARAHVTGKNYTSKVIFKSPRTHRATLFAPLFVFSFNSFSFFFIFFFFTFSFFFLLLLPAQADKQFNVWFRATECICSCKLATFLLQERGGLSLSVYAQRKHG